MPYLVASVLRANEVLAGLDRFEPEALTRQLAAASTVLEGVEELGLPEVLDAPYAAALRQLLGDLPPAVDAAVLAAARSALGRGVRVQLTWQPSAAVELRCWEVSEGSEGLLNLHLLTPEPDEGTPTG